MQQQHQSSAHHQPIHLSNPLDQIDVVTYVYTYLSLSEIDVTRRLSKVWRAQSENALWKWFGDNIKSFSLSLILNPFDYEGFDCSVSEGNATVTFFPRVPTLAFDSVHYVKGTLQNAANIYRAYLYCKSLLEVLDETFIVNQHLARLAGLSLRAPRLRFDPNMSNAAHTLFRRDMSRLRADRTMLGEVLAPYDDLQMLVREQLEEELTEWAKTIEILHKGILRACDSLALCMKTLHLLKVAPFPERGSMKRMGFELGGKVYAVPLPGRVSVDGPTIHRAEYRVRGSRSRPGLVCRADWLLHDGGTTLLGLHITCPISQWAQHFPMEGRAGDHRSVRP